MAQDFSNSEYDLKKRWALLQLQSGGDTSPVGHPLGAVARALQGAMGGYIAGQANAEDDAALGVRMNAPGLGGVAGALAQPPAQPQSAPPDAPMAGTAPRGIRNNNPGNIEDGPFAKKMPGYAGSDGRFARFEKPEHGMAAMDSLLASYGKMGINTVGGVINRWAPPSDNNPTSAYAGTVAKALSVDPNAPIDLSDPAVRSKIAQGIGSFENGKPFQVAQAGGVPPMPQGQSIQPDAPQQSPERAPSPIPAEMQAYIKQLYATKNRANIAKADALYQQFMKPVEVEQPGQKKTDDIREYEVAKKEGYKGTLQDFIVESKKAGAQNTVINNTVNPILKGVGDRFNTIMEAADAAHPQVNSIHEARRALDSGAFTGAAADPKLFLSKVANLFGLPNDTASNTEVLRSAVGSQVLEKAKTLGANPSNADRDYIEKVVGGKISLEENTIRRLLDMQERWARDAVSRANRMGERMLKAQPKELEGVAPFLRVDDPISYQDYVKNSPAKQTAPSVDDLVKKYSK